jgi:hypothetical protein
MLPPHIDNDMNHAQTSNTSESDRHDTADIALQLMPTPHPSTGSACAPQPHTLDSPEAFSGTGGEFSGAGASEGWADCATAASEGVSAAAEGAGSLLIDVVAGLLPF